LDEIYIARRCQWRSEIASARIFFKMWPEAILAVFIFLSIIMWDQAGGIKDKPFPEHKTVSLEHVPS